MQAKREPPDVAILAARLMRAFPALSPYSAASLADELERIESANRRHAERGCNGSPDVRRRPERGELFGYVKLAPLPAGRSPDPTAPAGQTWVDDPESKERAARLLKARVGRWLDRCSELADIDRASGPLVQFDFVLLKLRLPNESELIAV